MRKPIYAQIIQSSYNKAALALCGGDRQKAQHLSAIVGATVVLTSLVVAPWLLPVQMKIPAILCGLLALSSSLRGLNPDFLYHMTKTSEAMSQRSDSPARFFGFGAQTICRSIFEPFRPHLGMRPRWALAPQEIAF